MDKPKHTPGPWRWEHEWKEDQYSPMDDGCMGILEPGVLYYGMDGSESIYCPNEADARLIAAAPELLEACYEMKQYNMSILNRRMEGPYANDGYCKELQRQLKILDAAIAKAEGNSK